MRTSSVRLFILAATVALLVLVPTGDGPNLGHPLGAPTLHPTSAASQRQIPSGLPSLGRAPAALPSRVSGGADTLTVYAVYGQVATHGSPSRPLEGLNVTLVRRPCTPPVSPATCAYVASGPTNVTGDYAIAVAPGDYFVYANNTSYWGGDWKAITVSTSNLLVDLVAYPWATYGNATFDLPHWNNLSQYASNCNALPPCGTGIYGTQTPLLSWTEDGAYYVNASGRLVFYSFVNHAVRDIAYWKYLYDDIMNYQGIENTEWITADGAYVYEFGCAIDCASASSLLLYAVNTTTGRTFNHTFAGVSLGAINTNAQLNLIGEAGNASIAVVFGNGGDVVAYNLWNQSEWVIGTVPYFEANNIYWVSSLDSFFNIEAGGSSGDRIQQVELEGPAPGTRLVTVYSGTYASGFLVNGVNGMDINVTAHTLVVSELQGGGPVKTERFQLSGTGVLTGTYLTYADQTFGSWPDDSVPPNAWSSEHRPMIASDGPMVNGLYDGLFDNGSWLFEPSTGQFIETNLSFDHMRYASGSGLRQNNQDPGAVEGLFLNSSYGLVSESVNCRTNQTSCPIRGTAAGSVPGTVWWAWRTGLPEFPFPADAHGAQTLPPGPVSVSATPNASAFRLTWAPPSSGSNPVLNYTVFWGPAGGPLNRSANLWAQNLSFTVSGLSPRTSYGFLVQAWNLHWHNAGTRGNVTTTAPGPPVTVSSFAAAPPSVDVGGTTAFDVVVSGGLAPLTYTYSGLPTGCLTANVSRLVCAPAQPGAYTVTIEVSDPEGASTNASVGLTVGPALAVAIRASALEVDLPSPIALSAVLTSPGTPPYSFVWTLPSGPLAGPNVSAALPAAGVYTIGVVVTDQFAGVATASVTVTADPSLSIAGGVAPGMTVDAGATVWVNASAVGGAAPVLLTFGTLPPGCHAVGDGTVRCQGMPLGTANVTATAVDRLNVVATWSQTLTAVANPSVSLAASADPVPVGGDVDLSATVSGGIAPFRITFAGLPPGCTPSTGNGTLVHCRPGSVGQFTVTARVTDADNLTARSSVVLVVSGSAGPPISPGSLVIVAGVTGAAAAVAVGAFLWWRRRRTPPGPR